MIHQVSMMSLTRKMEPGCGSCDFSIRVLYLDLFCTSNTAIFGTENTCISCLFLGIILRIIGEEKKDC